MVGLMSLLLLSMTALTSNEGVDAGEDQLATINKQPNRSIKGGACFIIAKEEALDNDDDGMGDCAVATMLAGDCSC